jgi:hypothetical protein
LRFGNGITVHIHGRRVSCYSIENPVARQA